MWATLFQILLVPSVLGRDVLLPRPQGPDNVTIRTSELIDKSRRNPHDPQGGFRRIMVSAFSPTRRVSSLCKSPYMLDKVAEHYTQVFARYYNLTVDYSRFKLPLCSVDVTHSLFRHDGEGAAIDSWKEYQYLPLILFSPGLGATRFRYNAICASLASYGYLVLSIDHPYTVDIIQFPDNTIIKEKDPYGNPSEKFLQRHLPPRVKDMSFIVDIVSNNNTLANLLFPTAKPNITQVGVWGHSYGGAAAAQAILKDERFVGGINLDGSMYGSVVHKGFHDPFILFESDGHNRIMDPTWAEFYPKLTGFKRNLHLKGAEHNTFTDGPLLADLYGYNKQLVGVGSIPGNRALKIVTAYVRDFFGFVLLDKRENLVKRPSNKYPEVAFIP